MEFRKNNFVTITGFFLLCLTGVSLSGCYSSITAREVVKDQPMNLGLRYYLPSPYLVIRHLPNDTWDAELQVIVDRSHTFAVQPNAYFAKTDFSLVNNSDGTIKSFKLAQDTTVVAAASITAAKDIASKEMELRQATQDQQLKTAQKLSPSTAGTGSKGSQAPAAAASAAQAPAEAATDTNRKPVETATDATKKPVETATDATKKPVETATDATKKPVAPGGAGNEKPIPENVKSHLIVDFDEREVFIYRITQTGLEKAGPFSPASFNLGDHTPVAKVPAPIAVNMYERKDGTSETNQPTVKENIRWFGPIEVEVVQNDFHIRSATVQSLNDDDKKLFLFFTDEEGKTPVDNEVAKTLRELFTIQSGVLSIKVEKLKNANVKSVRFNRI